MNMPKGVFDLDSGSESDDAVIPKEAQPSNRPCKRTKMESLLHELKNKHDAWDADTSTRGDGSVFNRVEGDCRGSGFGPAPSTNLVLKPLSQSVDEHVLLAEFGRFGPIGSIKIIWPRGDRPIGAGNTGFVSFMLREDAETAMRTMGGIEFYGKLLSIGWGDPVPLPSVPLNVTSTLDKSDATGAIGATVVVAHGANPAATRERLEDGPAPKAILRGVGPDVVVRLPDTARRRYVGD